MRQTAGRLTDRFWKSAVPGILVALGLPLPSSGEIVTLKNGTQLEGTPVKIGSIADDLLHPRASGGEIATELIVVVNDGLRWTFVSYYQVRPPITPGAQVPVERIEIDKRVARGPRRLASIGQILRVTPFDEWGNRVVSMNTFRGDRVDVIQGITEITPTYAKVEGLLAQSKYSLVWDMRIATSSIPAETLRQILMKQTDPKSASDRLGIVRFYFQAQRYEDAHAELEAAMKEFPELAELEQRMKELRQLSAAQMVSEIEFRQEADQHQLAVSMLRSFPEEGVAGETLLKVREMLGEYGRRTGQGERAKKLLAEHLGELQGGETKAQIQPIREEIEGELSINTLDRMADYLRLADDEKLTAAQKLSLAISGWLLGSGSGTENLAVSLSLFSARNAVRSYLRAERQHERDAVLQHLQGTEGVSPSNLAKLLAHMKPAIEAPAPQSGPPGLYELSTPGLEGDPDIKYYVQLPPEYDPYRPRPCIVTLNGGFSELHQIDWWAGGYDEKSQMRLGQATRHGYIVIAPRWRKPRQVEHEFSAREHAAVLYSLRDACRRFAIDTDRVFLSGHSIGGDAAWDIGLAHPDLWAGVLPIAATADKYVGRYWENARYLSLYFVSGEMDGDKRTRNGVEWDRYLTKHDFDAIVVNYRGRGHEHFQDEIHRIFAWMKLHRRDFFPREFKCVSMRPWDNFFWWVEVAGYPERSMVAPLDWSKPRVTEAQTEGRVLANNVVKVSTAANRATVWLSPELVDFDQMMKISVNSQGRRVTVQPSVEVMLEDVRTRGDRQHPFWAKVE